MTASNSKEMMSNIRGFCCVTKRSHLSFLDEGKNGQNGFWSWWEFWSKQGLRDLALIMCGLQNKQGRSLFWMIVYVFVALFASCDFSPPCPCLEEQDQCLTPDINIKWALSGVGWGGTQTKTTVFHPWVLCLTTGMFSILDHAAINNMNVSVTMAKARISWVFLVVLCQAAFWILEEPLLDHSSVSFSNLPNLPRRLFLSENFLFTEVQ